MAKAQFHRNQKVWVATVGTWAVIEKVIPIWTRGFDEPVKITYDVGLGREFSGGELRAEDLTEDPASETRELMAAAARPQQVAAARGLPAPSVSWHLSGGGHRSPGLGRLARAGRRIRP